jgi:hypothetical protein
MNAQTPIQPSIVSALAAALPELESAKKNKAHPAFKSKYADLAAVIEALEPIRKHGLWYLQRAIENADGAQIETIYIHTSGVTLSAGTTFMPATKKDAQGFGSALSYCRRYGLQTAFGLATEDDDGNAAVKASQRTQSDAEPAKREASHSALKTAYRQFVHEANGCGDADELNAYLATPDALKVVREIKAKLPHIWDGTNWPESQPRPDEWEPLADFITRRQRECAQATANYMTA